MCGKIGLSCSWICWVVSSKEGDSSNNMLDHYYTLHKLTLFKENEHGYLCNRTNLNLP